MAKYELPHFGEIDTEHLETYYDSKAELGGRTIEIDLNFESTRVEAKRLDILTQFIAQLPDLDKRNKDAIQKDYEDGEYDTVGVYLEHHLEYIEEELLNQMINLRDSSVDPAIQLMSALHLVRVGLYPDNEDMFAIFDYSLGKDLTNYLVVIDTDEDGNISNMTMES